MAKTDVKLLSNKDKSLLISGVGAWHTYAVGDIPSIMMTDGPHGLRKQADDNNGINDSNKATCFPTACAVATSWNRQNAHQIGLALADEALYEQVSVVLGPGVNIKRSPLCGRNFEYFSEDAFLAGELATQFVKGVQSKGVGCCVKHFAVNSQETRRMTINAVVDERALREIYLTTFENVIKNAKPYCVMTGYNKVNGTPCAQNSMLLTQILRNEWGFDGLVMSDWGACYDVAQAVNAGMDLEMPDGGEYHHKLAEQCIENGEITAESIERACTKVANLAYKGHTNLQQVTVDYDKHNQLCRQIAADSAVLLKNQDNVLPLSKSSKVLVVGELAVKPRIQGAGSSHINAECASFLDVLQQNSIDFCYTQGYSVRGDVIDKKLQKQAVALAGNYDAILFFGGLTDDFEGEGYDRKTLQIPNCQQQLLKELNKVNNNIVFVAFGGSPFAMDWLDDTKALLNMYLGGQAVTSAAFDIVFGDVSPSGRLAETYPLKLQDTPCYNYFCNDYFVDEHRESIFVGYRYYNTFDVPTLFPFGYGLSYTEFTYSDLQLYSSDDGVDVIVTVTNSGNVDGSEVVQLYVDNPVGDFMRAKRELRAFDKIFLQAGESQKVCFHLDDRAFSAWIDGEFTVVEGQYGVSICSNVDCAMLTKSVMVLGKKVTLNQKESLPDYFQRVGDSWTIDKQQFYALACQPQQEYVLPKRGEFTLQNTLGDMASQVGLVRLMKGIIKGVAKRQAPSKRMSDPVAQMIFSGAMETPLISLMSVGNLPSNLVLFLLNHANKKHGEALKCLFGKNSK